MSSSNEDSAAVGAFMTIILTMTFFLAVLGHNYAETKAWMKAKGTWDEFLCATEGVCATVTEITVKK